MEQPRIHTATISKGLILLTTIVTIIYFSWWFYPSHVGNPFFFYPLFFGEVYHVGMILLFLFTIWPRAKRLKKPQMPDFHPSVDVFITVAGEPIDVIRKTAVAAKQMNYPVCNVFLLNDGFVAKKAGWRDVEQLARELDIGCFTREESGGAKAGNINNALRHTTADLVAIFDADMIPHPDFLERTVLYFAKDDTGFVQSPQYYKNSDTNEITKGAWEQQEFFFGPIMVGKDSVNASFICGTNVVLRRKALEEVGGMDETNIAEDFLTSVFIHQKHWQSYYVKDVLAEGLAPEDLLSYYKQQLRWARGNLDVLVSFNPLLRKGMSFSQKLQYLSSTLFYFNGVVVLIDIAMPVLALFTGSTPVATTTTSFAFFFIPFIFLSLYTLYKVSKEQITFRAISFSQSSFILQLEALLSVLRKQDVGFSVTPKQMQQGNFLFLAYPHIAYGAVAGVAIIVAVLREGLTPSVSANLAWVFFNMILFLPFIRASYGWKKALHLTP